jgi:hypothetical protein
MAPKDVYLIASFQTGCLLLSAAWWIPEARFWGLRGVKLDTHSVLRSLLKQLDIGIYL